MKKLVLTAILCSLAGCSSPLTSESVEENVRETYSQNDAEIIWLTVDEQEDGSFVVNLDVEGDPLARGGQGEPDRSSTVRCTVSGNTSSSNRNCRSVSPSIPDQIRDGLTERMDGRNFEPTDFSLERNDDGTITGTATGQNRASGQQDTANVSCEVEMTDEESDFNCSFS